MSRLDRIEDWTKLAELAAYDCSKLARLCLVSGTHLRRYFCSRFHKPPQRLLNEMRLWDAAQLLRSSQFSIKDIARELYFANESQLCHQFKAYFGCTPSKYVSFYFGSNGRASDKLPKLPRLVMQRRSDGVPLWDILSSPESACVQESNS